MSARKDKNKEKPLTAGTFFLKVKFVQTVKRGFSNIKTGEMGLWNKDKMDFVVSDGGDNILSSGHDGEKLGCPPCFTPVSPVVPPFISRPLTRRK